MSTSRHSHLVIYLAILAALLFSSQLVLAQVTTGTILGTVKDETGAVMPGVSVAVKHLDTGALRTVVTDDEGRYRAPNLALGNYEIEAELGGFQTAVRTGIKLTVGREAIVDFALKLGAITERLTVTGEAPLVETTKSELSDLVDEKKIRDLPLNGRSYTQLALLQPGVVVRSTSTTFNALTGGGVKLAIGGARPMNTFFYLDGTDIRDAFGRTPGSAGGQNLGVDTIREFTVLTNAFSAEFGGSGGVINTVSKSGTNNLHGSVFEFHRNSALDARNFFDREANPPPFKRNQFGFTVGGPIKPDRTFFFGSYEGLRQRLSASNVIRVPDTEARAGRLPSGPVTIPPLIKKYLDAMPLPNGRIFNDGTGEFLGTQSIPVDEDYFMVKVDQQLGSADSFYVRYTIDDATQINPRPFPQFSVDLVTRYQYLTIEENKIISPALLNTFRFAFNRSNGGSQNRATTADASLSLIPLPDALAPQTDIPALSQFGTSFIGDRAVAQNVFQFTDKLSYVVGRHSIKTGVDIFRIQQNGFSAFLKHGQVRYNSYQDFLEGRIFTWQFLVPGTGTIRGFRQNDFASYVTDDIKVNPNLTVNLGLRWEFVTPPTEVTGRIANLRDVFHDTEPTIGDPFFRISKINLDPRIGIAWDPFGTAKTALRAGWGIFHQQATPILWNVSIMQMPPYQVRAQIVRPPLPPPATSSGPSTANPSPTEFDVKTPDMMQYNFTVQQQLWGGTVLSASYAGSRGVHLSGVQNYNIAKFDVLPDGRKFWPVGAPRFNPAFAAMELRTFGGNSSYNSLQLRLNKRFSRGMQLQGSYTFSKNLDNISEIQSGFMDPYDTGRARGLSDNDVRQSFSFNWTYDLPLGSNLTGVAGTILSQWQINGLLNVTSGVPLWVSYSVNRSRNLNTTVFIRESPDLKPGANSNPVLGGPDRYLDSSPFQLAEAGTLGNLGRNTAIGPGLATLDFSLVKNFHMSEARYFQFRAEFFNLFNRANFGLPNANIFTDTSGNPSGSFGRISDTATTSRQIQFALKLLF
ncbi:MAG: TonB-dependent receptor [Acidobacteria bacterium]|nr:TonB-dependent receptor [Acidobacteriota bacterium]